MAEAKKLHTIISGFQKPSCGSFETYGITDEALLRFCSWMIKDSPWASCFKNRRAKDVMEGHWLLDIDSPANLLASACMATRLPSEYPNSFLVWDRLVSLGLDGAKAYVAAMHLTASGKGVDIYPVSISIKYGHIPFHSCWNKTYYENFLNNNRVNIQGPYREVLNFNNASGIWGKEGGYDGRLDLIQNLKPRVERKPVDSHDIWYNPLKEKNKVDYHFRSDEELLHVWEDIEKIILSR